MAQVSCIWKAPFTAVQILPGLPGTAGTQTLPIAITPDGATVVGQALGEDGTWRAVRWNTATLAITELAHVLTNARALGISSNGAFIVGSSTTGSNGGNQQLIRWSGGGSAGSLLPIAGSSGNSFAIWYDGAPFRLISDDGAVVGGYDGTDAARISAATKWINGVNTNLIGLATTPTDNGALPGPVSADGSIMVGHVGQHNQTTTNQPEAGYWVGTTMRRLVVPPVSITGATGLGNTNAQKCSSDASVIWGDTPNWAASANVGCYWTNVSTLSGDGIHYGVSHIMAQLPNTQQQRQNIFWVADDPGALVAVGTSPAGASGRRAAKWVGTTAYDLPTIDGMNSSEPWGCNHDGTIICGWSYDSGFATWPVRWDASNALHVLPTLADPGDSFQGQALGISRDGSVIFGVIDVSGLPPPPPPPTASLAMDDVVVTAEAGTLSENLISLRWSDDRGHSWSNPVTQPFGAAGEYDRSLQWNRLGYARDRVWELFWSVPAPTALQGAWITAQPGDGKGS